MCLTKFLSLCSLEKVFKFACTVLTLILIGQEVVNFAITKPTVTSMEEKGLEIDDIPEVLICIEPGLDKEVLKKYGYNRSALYYRGSQAQAYPGRRANGRADHFIGWNGDKNETKSSLEILEEALIIKHEHINEVKFITWAFYTDDSGDGLQAKVNLRSLAWPYGRCFSISLPDLQENENTEKNTLYLKFDESVFKSYKDINIKMYFMERTNSLNIHPDQSSMTGDSSTVLMKRFRTFKTKISRSKHVQGNPHLKCTEYTLERSYNNCTNEELIGQYIDILGCIPPVLGNVFSTTPKIICNQTMFNISKEKVSKVEKLWITIFNHNLKFTCETPCTTTKYTTRLLQSVPHAFSAMHVVFDKTVDITHSTFSISEQTLLTRLGGSVSSGRTLLWILVSLLGTTKVVNDTIPVLNKTKWPRQVRELILNSDLEILDCWAFHEKNNGEIFGIFCIFCIFCLCLTPRARIPDTRIPQLMQP